MNLIPKEGEDRRRYCPDRDFAHAFVPLAYYAAQGLDQERWESYFADYLLDHGVTEEQLGQGALCLLQYHQHLCDPQFANAQEALAATGWDDLPEAVHFVVWAKMGQILTRWYFEALRETTPFGQPPGINAEYWMTQARASSQHMMRRYRRRRRWKWLRSLIRLRRS